MSHKSTKNNLTLWTLQQTWTTSACVGMFCLLWCHFFNYVQIITSLKSVQPRLKLYVNKVNKQMTTNINLTFFHHILLNTQNILIQMISKHRNNRFPFFLNCVHILVCESTKDVSSALETQYSPEQKVLFVYCGVISWTIFINSLFPQLQNKPLIKNTYYTPSLSDSCHPASLLPPLTHWRHLVLQRMSRRVMTSSRTYNVTRGKTERMNVAVVMVFILDQHRDHHVNNNLPRSLGGRPLEFSSINGEIWCFFFFSKVLVHLKGLES